jgi:pimeloyl-ACP methyl ester carboxylesterase
VPGRRDVEWASERSSVLQVRADLPAAEATRGPASTRDFYPIEVAVEIQTWAKAGWRPPEAPAPDRGVEPVSLVVTLDTGDRLHYLDWERPAAPGPPEDVEGPVDAHGAAADHRHEQESGSERVPSVPLLLLVHGLGQTGWIWAPVARRLRALTRVLAPDLRGHGLSDSPRSGYDLESLAYDLLTVLVANGFGPDAGGPPAVVAGHGLGAMAAVAMARVQPAAVAGVALVDGGWEDLAESTGQLPDEFLRGLGDPPEVMRSMEAYLGDRREYDPDTWDADQERAARATVDQKYAGHVVSVTRQHVLKACVEAMFGYRPEEALGDLEPPLLVAVAEAGTADDEIGRERWLALSDVLQLRSRFGRPPARVVRFPGAGHNLMRYRPGELASELLGLLEVSGATSGGTRGDRA